MRTAGLLRRGLCEEGYSVDIAVDGPDAVWRASEFSYDAVVLDVMLPGYDGIEVCRRLRDRGRWAPVLMLTARDDLAARVRGLDSGADDYLAKPFSFDELFARLRAHRSGPPSCTAAASGWTPRPGRRGVGRRNWSCHPRSSRCWSCSFGIPARY